jgi:hypothetical protein
MKFKALIASATAALMTACGSVDVDHYAKETPKLELSSFFTGTIDAWGIFQKRNGEVARRFHVEILTEKARTRVSSMSGLPTPMVKNNDASGHSNGKLTELGRVRQMMWWVSRQGVWLATLCIGLMCCVYPSMAKSIW